MLKIPENLYPYLYFEHAAYSQESVRIFHQITGQGKSYIGPRLSRQDNINLSDLLQAHSIASREPSGILEGLWEVGGDYPLCLVGVDIMRDLPAKPWQQPLFERWKRWYVRVKGARALRTWEEAWER